ncbi:putative type VI secretion system protein [Escherichia coli]|uniref:Putative type VI secretion system protein n=1 Tax=Escherichia coli TaxID=562 RepID=A0A484W098_ECOLX|nr:putative type VI secretion system protein [Escherichia coli]
MTTGMLCCRGRKMSTAATACFRSISAIPKPSSFSICAMLRRYQTISRSNAFTLRLHFNRPLPADIKLRQDSLRLHCTPAINLFTHYAEPVRPDGRMAEYPLRASHKHPDAYDIFQVSTVTSKVKVSGTEISPGSQARVWPEFESFQHQMEYSRQREVVYWHHRTKTSLLHHGLEHSIAFVHADGSIPGSSRF